MKGKTTLEVIVTGALRLAVNYDLFKTYERYINPEMFYQEDEISTEIRCLRHLLKTMKNIIRNDVDDLGKDKFTEAGIREKMLHYLSKESDAEEFLKIYDGWWQNPYTIKNLNDSGVFGLFLDYLKNLQFLVVASDFQEKMRSNDVDKAKEFIHLALTNINKINAGEVAALDEDDYRDIFFSGVETTSGKKLYLGNAELDNIFDGWERQTLNGVLAVTNGGKSMFCHHIIREAIRQKIHVWVGVLEDRKKSFIYKNIACLTGISISNLRRAGGLDQSSKDLIEKAIADMREYVRVEFIYGKDIGSVHRSATEYDAECQLRGRPVPIINMVDYTGHVAARSGGDKMYEKMRNAYAERKDFCLKNNKIGIDFAQINREGSKNLRGDDAVITQNDLAGAFDIAQVFDNIISLNRSPADIDGNKCRIHVCKGRDSAVGDTVMVATDFAMARYNMNISSHIKKSGSD